MTRHWLAVACGLISTCAWGRDSYPEFPIEPASGYEQRSTKGGLTVAIVALRAPDQVQTYFGADLLKGGLLPVLVILENESDDSSFLLATEDLAYAVGDAAEDALDSPEGSPHHQGKAANGLGIASAALLSPVGLVAAAVLSAKASRIQVNMAKKELRSQTVAPHENMNGFLFIPIDKHDPTQLVRLRVRARRLGSNESQDYVFDF